MKRRGLHFTFSVQDMPQTLLAARQELAKILRDEADAETDARVARRLREIAAAFEAGQRPERGDG